MDRTEMTNQRRQEIVDLLRGMKIKKSAVGGFDKEDVYSCMQQLCDLYESNIGKLELVHTNEVAEAEQKLKKYDTNNDVYVNMMMEAKKNSNEVILQAKSEVERILEDGRKVSALKEQEKMQDIAKLQGEKTKLQAEIQSARDDIETELIVAKNKMISEIETEKARLKTELENERRQAQYEIDLQKEKFVAEKEKIERDMDEERQNLEMTLGLQKSTLESDVSRLTRMLNDQQCEVQLRKDKYTVYIADMEDEVGKVREELKEMSGKLDRFKDKLLNQYVVDPVIEDGIKEPEPVDEASAYEAEEPVESQDYEAPVFETPEYKPEVMNGYEAVASFEPIGEAAETKTAPISRDDLFSTEFFDKPDTFSFDMAEAVDQRATVELPKIEEENAIDEIFGSTQSVEKRMEENQNIIGKKIKNLFGSAPDTDEQ
ncbi:MAG: hypothetical protein RSA73_06315 [Anaerovoracaceae bacterium]